MTSHPVKSCHLDLSHSNIRALYINDYDCRNLIWLKGSSDFKLLGIQIQPKIE